MKLCVVGIGGAGGKVTQEFLENDDLDLKLISWITQAEYISTGGIKGIWLEADKNDAKNIQHFFGDLTEGAYPGFFIPHDVVGDGSELHVEVKKKYGYDVKKQGFVRDAQYLKAIYEIFETDKNIQQIADKTMNGDGGRSSILNPIFDGAWNTIRPYTTLGGGDCDGILFIVSFGGGTGTGFINPIINHIRNEGKADYPVFVLGILTELGDFADRAQFAKEGRRNLAAISAIYDLLTKSNGANGVIMVDNQILMDRFGNDYASANKFIYEIMRPIVAARDFPGEIPPSQAIAQHFSEGVSRPPLFVPLYAAQTRRKNPEEDLVRKALAEGKLFGCVPVKADWAIAFCRGFVDSEMIRQAISAQMGLMKENIWVLRKMGEGDDEILVLLRNPYGLDSEAYKKEGTLENRLCQVITLASRYMRQNVEALFYEGKDSTTAKEGRKNEQIKLTEEAKVPLKEFFFGKQMGIEDYGIIKDNFDNTGGFAFELREARKRLKAGDKPPLFTHPLRIFDKDAGMEEKDKAKAEAFSLDEQRILEIVDKRVEQKLADLKLK